MESWAVITYSILILGLMLSLLLKSRRKLHKNSVLKLVELLRLPNSCELFVIEYAGRTFLGCTGRQQIQIVSIDATNAHSSLGNAGNQLNLFELQSELLQ